MPERVDIPKGGKKKKKGGFWGKLSSAAGAVENFERNFFQGAEDAATGFPTGVVALAHALDQALPKSVIPGVDEGHRQDYKPLKKIGKSIVLQTKEDLRHPLRDPFSTALTVGGLASLGLGTAFRGAAGVSAASKASNARLAAGLKAAARPKPATRKLKTIKKPATTETKKYTTKSGKKLTQTVTKKNPSRELELEANPSHIVRGLRKVTIDPLYNRSRMKAEADFDNPKAGRYARMVERRTMDQRKRYAENLDTAINPKPPVEIPDDPVRNITRSPMDLMRMSMYLRPRYYLQNLGGTGQLMAHAGVSLGDAKAVRKIAKSDPELYRLMIAAGGETGTTSISMGTSGGGKLGRTAARAAELANRPEAHMRTVGVWKAAKDYGITDPAQLKSILKKPDSDEAQLIMARANESMVDYGRVGGSGTVGQLEKKFVQSGLPIFYPMMKGFTRYGTRFPTQHPIQSSLIGALGQEGKDIQRENLGGEPQPWFPYITPLQGGKTQNLQNVMTFSPGADVIRQTAQALPGAERHETLNLLQAFGPLAELIVGATSGRQLATGFEYDEDTLDKYGSALTALGDTAKSVVPGMEYLGAVPGLEPLQRNSAAYGEPSLEQSLMLALLGPGLVQRKTNFKKVVQPKKKKPGRKRKSSGRF